MPDTLTATNWPNWCHRMVIVGKANRSTTASCQFPTPQPPCNEGDTPHEVSVPPGTQCPQGSEEERVWHVERIPLSSITPRGHALHYFYHTLGTVLLPDCLPGVQSVRWRVHRTFWLNNRRCAEQNEVCGRHPTVVLQAFHDAADWLCRCGANGITLSSRRTQSSLQDLRSDPQWWNQPANLREQLLNSIYHGCTIGFGLVNQVAYSFSRADTVQRPSTMFSWTQEAFGIDQIQTGVEIFDNSWGQSLGIVGVPQWLRVLPPRWRLSAAWSDLPAVLAAEEFSLGTGAVAL